MYRYFQAGVPEGPSIVAFAQLFGAYVHESSMVVHDILQHSAFVADVH